MERNLQILSRFADTATFVYVEHASIERHDLSIEIRRQDDSIDVPAASVSTLVLGPGTRITHAAVVALSECGAAIVWAGEEAQRFYACGMGKTRSSSNLLKQATAWADPERRKEVVRRMYLLRFDENLPSTLSLAQIRGREGVRVREAYAAASREFGVEWTGRRYDRADWNAADPVNRALSAGAAILYGICHSAISSAGYSAGIGFIHTGKALAFVYDLADLYKVDLLVPAAFEAASGNADRPEASVRRLLRQRCRDFGLMERAMHDLTRLFADRGTSDASVADELDATDPPGHLWDPMGNVPSGVNHGGDDA